MTTNNEREYKEGYNAPIHFVLNIDPFKREETIFDRISYDESEVYNDN